MNIKVNDKVIVIAGKDKGTEGAVTRVLREEDRVIVEGVNVAKKHAKSKERGKKGEIVNVTMPIHISNVSLIDPKDGKATRVSYKMEGDKKVRIASRSGQEIK